jgi:hypothetical protein
MHGYIVYNMAHEEFEHCATKEGVSIQIAHMVNHEGVEISEIAVYKKMDMDVTLDVTINWDKAERKK